MTHKLHISDDLELPAEAVTQTFAILAKRGVGKTYTASVMAEEFVKAGLPFVVLDPTGAWWGLRSSADGKSEGLPVTIFGGAHGDLPLEPTAGKVIAELVAQQPGFYVLDLSQTSSNAEQDRLACDFAEKLYRAKEANRHPVHLFVDEADSFAPQRPMPGQQRMLGAFEALVRRGRLRGIGMTLISQRAAVLNKNVLTQTEALILLQMTAPQDQDAVDDWVKRNASAEERKQVMDSMSSLEKGDAWIWSPAWLKVCKLVRVRPRRTFNSSATPEVGTKVIIPQKLAPVDLQRLSAEMKATIERTKANDPAELRKEIAALKKELQSKGSAKPELKTVEVPILKKEQVSKLGDIANHLNRSLIVLMELQKAFDPIAKEILTAVRRTHAPRPPTVPSEPYHPPLKAPRPRSYHQEAARYAKSDETTPSGGLRRMMVALAQRPGISAKQLGVRAGLSSSSGTFGTYLGKLRSNRWIDGMRDRLELTAAGTEVLGPFTPLPEGPELLDYWLGELGQSGAARMLKCLADAYPDSLTAEELGDRCDMSASSGTFGTYLGKLRALELIEGSRSSLSASKEFFE